MTLIQQSSVLRVKESSHQHLLLAASLQSHQNSDIVQEPHLRHPDTILTLSRHYSSDMQKRKIARMILKLWKFPPQIHQTYCFQQKQDLIYAIWVNNVCSVQLRGETLRIFLLYVYIVKFVFNVVKK